MPKAESNLRFNPPLSFTFQHRLASSNYNQVFEQGKRFRTPCFQFISLQDATLPNALGLVISKKNVSGSVRRNLCKRLAREYFRLHQQAAKPLQVIVMASPAAQNASQEELHACFKKFWHVFSGA